MPRMQILTTSEQTAFDKPPLFNAEQRKQFFSFPKSLLEIANTLRIPSSQIGFLLLCGYFRATKRFFLPQEFLQRDIESVAQQLALTGFDFIPGSYTETTRLRHQKIILECYGFSSFDSKAESALATEINTMAKAYLKPKLVFDRCADFLIQKRIVIPSSRTLSDLIRAGLQEHKAKLIDLMDTYLNEPTRRLLDNLFATPDDQNQHRLTLLKKLSQSTKPSQVKESIAYFETLSELYYKLDIIISTLDLGYEGIRYYAGSVIKSQIFQLHQRSKNDRYIHATAFIAHQFFRIQDNLADIFLSVMVTFQNTATRAHKEHLFEQRKAQNQQLKAVVDELDSSVFGLLRDMRSLIGDAALSDTEKVIQMKTLLGRGKTKSFEQLKEGLQQAGQSEVWHEILEQHSVRLQNRLNPILKSLTFEPIGQADDLMDAISHFKNKEGVITDKAPTEFLNDDECKAIMGDNGTFKTSLYKVFLFQHVATAIKSGHLNLGQSYKYRPMDTYLIDKARWERDKLRLLKRAGLTEFTDPEHTLKTLDTTLFQQYQETNTAADSNPYLTIRDDGTFHIKTPALDTHETESLQNIFPARHDVPLAQVLDTVDRHSDMLKAFEHWQQSHTTLAVSRPVLLASIMGLGCGIGIRKMARISSQMTENNFRVLSDFRKNNAEFFHACFKQTVGLALELKLASLGHVSLDGSKFKADSSKHKAMSYKHLKAKEAALTTAIDDLIKQAASCDTEEDAAQGSHRGDELPKELAFKQTRLDTIKTAKAALEKREAVLNPGKVIDDKKQISFADEDARIMGKQGDFNYRYNGQISVDSDHQIIVGQHVSQHANDKQEVDPALVALKDATDQLPDTMSLDNGYYSGDNLEELEKAEVEAYVAVDRGEQSGADGLADSNRKLVKADFVYDAVSDSFRCPAGQILPLKTQGKAGNRVYQGEAATCQRCPYHKRCCRSQAGEARTISSDGQEVIRQQMRKRMMTDDAKAIYKRRKVIVEPVFGHIKNGGFRGFSLRGREKVAGELSLVCAAHNLKKMVKAAVTGLVRPDSGNWVAQAS